MMPNLLEPSVARRLLQAWKKDDIRDMLARAARRMDITDFTAAFTRTIGGCAGYACPKVPITFHWQAGRDVGTVHMLLKVTPWGPGEGAAYRYLEPLGAPVPRCYGAMRVPDAALPNGWRPGAEAIFLEYLDHIGFDRACLADRLAFARAYAVLHALPPNLRGAPRWATLRYRDGVAVWLTRLRETTAAAAAALPGTAVAEACGELAGLLPHAPAWLARTAEAADNFPVGLIHKDASPQNTGWRGAREEPLLFDLQPMCIGGLMSDLLTLFPNEGLDEHDRQVARAYCDALRERRGPALTPDEIARGTRLARVLRRVGILAWQVARSLDGRVDWTDDAEEGQRTYRAWLHESLSGIARDLRAYRGRAGHDER
jgi:hypothetical protein